HPNVYGIDMPAVDEFIANGKTIDEINTTIGSDKLFYQRLDDLEEVTGHKETSIDGYHSSCFNGQYVTGDITQAYLDKLREERNDASKQEKLAEDEQGIDMHNDQA
ncbi:MAG: amidophosphoribosyltransferase, partial [Candidatus Poseidoniaceae archaeon]